MHYKKNQITALGLFLSLCVMASSMAQGDINITKAIGYISMMLFLMALLIGLSAKISSNKKIYIDGVAWVIALYIIWIIFNARFLSGIYSAATPIYCFLIYISVVNVFSSASILYSILNLSCKIIILSSALSWVLMGLPLPYSFIYKNANSFSIALFSTMAVFLVTSNSSKVKENIFWIGLSIFVIVLTGTRSTLLAFFPMILIFLFQKYDISLVRMKKTILTFILLVSFGFIYFYSQLYGTDLGAAINASVRELTGKNFYSGRQVIWSSIINTDSIWEVIFGHGSSMKVSELIELDLSAHNSFVQIYFQNGLIGLSLILLLFYLVLDRATKSSNPLNRVFAFPLIIGFTIVANFEVFIFQNQPVAALMFTIFIAIVCSGENNRSHG